MKGHIGFTLKRALVSAVCVTPAIALVSCGLLPVRGSGAMIEETRHEGAEFHTIGANGVVDVEYARVDEADKQGLKLHIDDNLAEYIETSVSSGELSVDVKPFTSIMPSQGAHITIYGQELREIRSSGTADLSAEAVPVEGSSFRLSSSGTGDVTAGLRGAEELDVHSSGTGDVVVEDGGKATGNAAAQLDVTMRGTGDLDAQGFPVQAAEVTTTGTADLRLTVSESLTGTQSGTGDIYYSGRPAIDIDSSGTGDIRYVE